MHKIMDESAAVYPFRSRLEAEGPRRVNRTTPDDDLTRLPTPHSARLAYRAPANGEMAFDARVERTAIDLHLGRFLDAAQDEGVARATEEPFADPDHFAGILLQAMAHAAGLDLAYTRRVAVAIELASSLAFVDDSPGVWTLPVPRDVGPFAPAEGQVTAAGRHRELIDAFLATSVRGVDRSMMLALRLAGDRHVGQEVRKAMSLALAHPERPVPLFDVSCAVDAAAKFGQMAALAIDVLRHRHGPRRSEPFDERLLVAGHAMLALHAAVRLLGLLRMRIERIPSDHREHVPRIQTFISVASAEIGRRTFSASRAISALHAEPSVMEALVKMVGTEVRRGRWVCAAG